MEGKIGMIFEDPEKKRRFILRLGLIILFSALLTALFNYIVTDHFGQVFVFAIDMFFAGAILTAFFPAIDEELERRPRAGVFTAILFILLILMDVMFWSSNSLGKIDAVNLFMFIFAVGPLLVFAYLLLSYSGDKSKLYGLKDLANKFPIIKKPEGHVHFKTKMFWTIFTLILYFAMTNVIIFGLDPAKTIDLFAEYRAILAGAQGSLMHLGIGPIVTGSIIMQLFTGAKIIKLDLTKSDDKAVYQNVQKLIVVVMIVVEAIPQVYGFLTPSTGFVVSLDAMTGGYGSLTAQFLIVFQLCVGSYLVFFMDELVSKWGIGSGISLFIAAGVSQAIFTGTLNWETSPAVDRFGVPGTGGAPTGTIPKTIYLFQYSTTSQLANSGGMEAIVISPPNSLIALAGTVVVFLIVAYAESTRIELPLAHGKVRGARGRYPIRLIYASNIPVILMAALMANINMFSLLLWQHPAASNIPGLGHNWLIGAYPTESYAMELGISQTTPISGLAYYLSAPNGLSEWLLPLMNPQRYGGFLRGHEYWQVVVHVAIYFSVMVIGSIFFAKFWIDTTGMGPESVARQIRSSGMQIPGFRRDPRVLKHVLERYIPVVTVISGAFVGALAAGAQMMGTVGDTSGTGVLLTVGILIRLYEEIGKEQLMEMHPVLRGFFGSGG